VTTYICLHICHCINFQQETTAKQQFTQCTTQLSLECELLSKVARAKTVFLIMHITGQLDLTLLQETKEEMQQIEETK